MDYPGFGAILIGGERFDHDVVVEADRVRRRKKGPSKPYRNRYGHTPLSPHEEVPWSALRKREDVGSVCGDSGVPRVQDTSW